MNSNTSSAIELDFYRLQLELASRPNWQIWIEALAWGLIELLIFIGNFATLKIIYSNPNLRTLPNYLIASLAFSDLGLGFFAGLPCLGVLITSRWPYSEGTCQFHGIASLTLACASVLNLTLMAVNRYFSIVKQTKYRIYFTPKRTVCYIAIVWILSFVGSLSYIPFGHKYVFNPGKFFCYVDVQDYAFLAITVIFYIFLPTNVIAFCYYNIYRVIKKHNNSMSNWQSSHEIKITRMLFVIVVMFMFCWIPVFLMDIIDIIRLRHSLPREAYVLYSFFAGSSSSINPLLYGIMNPNFGREYKKMFPWLARKILPETRLESLSRNQSS